LQLEIDVGGREKKGGWGVKIKGRCERNNATRREEKEQSEKKGKLTCNKGNAAKNKRGCEERRTSRSECKR